MARPHRGTRRAASQALRSGLALRPGEARLPAS
jgi:hypothetical protein